MLRYGVGVHPSFLRTKGMLGESRGFGNPNGRGAVFVWRREGGQWQTQMGMRATRSVRIGWSGARTRLLRRRSLNVLRPPKHFCHPSVSMACGANQVHDVAQATKGHMR